MNTTTRIKNNLIYAYHRNRMNRALKQANKIVGDMSEQGREKFVKYSIEFMNSAKVCMEIPLH